MQLTATRSVFTFFLISKVSLVFSAATVSVAESDLVLVICHKRRATLDENDYIALASQPYTNSLCSADRHRSSQDSNRNESDVPDHISSGSRVADGKVRNGTTT